MNAPSPALESRVDTRNEDKSGKSREDPDTCRICRAEGSPEEPLFYPCKCSGSIKYVHQECLMEWLSHSQKKYCELCKTPFHFTKLYSPEMPKTLPTNVFLQRAVLHVLSHLATWIRGLLVGCMWLICVPGVIRYIWRVMFWLGDAGWARDSQLLLPMLDQVPEEVLSAANSTAILSIIATETAQRSLVQKTHIAKDSFAADSMIFRLAKRVLNTLAIPLRRSEQIGQTTNRTVDPLTIRLLEQSRSSILSDVEVLKTLTPWPHTNRFVMDVLEGQIITLSVVIVVILVFLIREWVVQQQPVVDLGAADAEVALAEAGGEIQHDPEVNAEPDREAGEAPELEDVPNQSLLTGRSFRLSNADQDLSNDLERLRTKFSALAEFDQSGGLSTGSGNEDLRDEYSSLLRTVTPKVMSVLQQQSASLDDVREVFANTGVPLDMLYQLYHNNQESDEVADSVDDGEPVRPDDAIPSSSSSRPPMPTRGQSFIAATLAREMEERRHDGTFNAAASEETSRSGKEEEGDESSGSWQHISRFENSIAKAEDQSERSETENPVPATNQLCKSESASIHSNQDHDDNSTTNSITGIESLERPSDPRDETNTAPAVDAERDRPSTANSEDAAEEPKSILHLVTEWFWGDIVAEPSQNAGLVEQAPGEDDEQVVDDIANEAPFVRFADAQPIHERQREEHNAEAHAQIQPDRMPGREFGLELDLDALEARAAADADAPPNELGIAQIAQLAQDVQEARAVQAARANPAVPVADANVFDADAIEDAEDLEGILELIGMQGPLIGLVQNAIFSLILIGLSVALFIFVPYIWGKLVLLHVAEPSLLYKVPLKTCTAIADLAIDIFLASASSVLWVILQTYRIITTTLLHTNVMDAQSYRWKLGVSKVLAGAFQRMVGNMSSPNDLQSGDFLYLSVACHAALHTIELWFAQQVTTVSQTFRLFTADLAVGSISSLIKILTSVMTLIVDDVKQASGVLFWAVKSFYTTGSIPVSMGTRLIVPDEPMLTYWNARDRAIAVLAGYAAVGLASGLYAQVAPITSSPRGRRIESYIIDGCQQAGGVVKVIFIISIEMIAFPLFCGFLLDCALLPLFDGASFHSRMSFFLLSPWTSGFVHWFVGTCYMFHFALFVSMCRGILRKGVLYFIRDPDDPTFHPVRDVLERNVITQLRKIAFSAIVYGALIVVCLGGIVWGLWLSCGNVLPIHWSSTGSFIEFPLDILFFNFLTPFVVHYAKPSTGITAMYNWWFRKVARMLRLSDFLFRDVRFDEQGSWKRHTWKAYLSCQINTDLTEDDIDRHAIADGSFEYESLDDGVVCLIPDGRYVRAPATDQVRIPKGTPVFVPVDFENRRLDGKPEDEGIHSASSDQTTKVYIPPWFKIRLGAFVTAVWLFAAATGISVTIIPLLFGRTLLVSILGPEEFINDIYAFSIGAYILGGSLYAYLHRQQLLTWVQANLVPSQAGARLVATWIWTAVVRILGLLYVYTSLAIGLPLMNALLLELYVLMPLHFVFESSDQHVMHLVQDWTLGILYVRIMTRIALSNPDSRPNRAMRQVFANGYGNPNPRLATRYFIVPAAMLFLVLVSGPYSAAWIVNRSIFSNDASSELRTWTLRMAYPAAAGIGLAFFLATKIMNAARRWRMRIRDEVYLVGERLHNFGERRMKKKSGKNKGKGKGREAMTDGVAVE